MTRVFLIRHGQSVWNKEMKYQGHSDIALTEEGIRQAHCVANRLSGENIAAVYASDLSRAFITGETIAARHGLRVTALPALREISFGEWEGLTYTGINEKWPDHMRSLYTNADDVVIPGGETFRELKMRSCAAIEELVRQHKDETIAVVSHGGTIRTLLCAALNIHLNYVWNIRQDNTAVNILDYYEDRIMVSLINDAHHLE